MLGIVVEARREAQRTVETMNRALQPTLRVLNSDFMRNLMSMANAANRHMEPLLRFQKQMDSVLGEHREALGCALSPFVSAAYTHATHPETIHYIPARPVIKSEPREINVESIAEELVAVFAKKGLVLIERTTFAQIDLVYNRKNRTLEYSAGTAHRATSFQDTESNKRRELFDTLVQTKRKITGRELKKILGCPNTDATYKVVQGLNRKMKNELGLTVNIVDGSGRDGYHIHKTIAIHPK